VDISPLRRVNQAIYLITTGAREAAFRNVKTIAECLADELVNAAKGSSNRYPFYFCLQKRGGRGEHRMVLFLKAFSIVLSG
jgi:ribosomal protein S7